MNTVLIKAIVDQAVFFGLSGEDVIDPDAAVSQLEQLAFTLKKLDVDDRRIFKKFLQEMVTQEMQSAGDNERVSFLQKLPEHLGIEE